MHPKIKATSAMLDMLGHVGKKMRTDRLASKFPKAEPPPSPALAVDGADVDEEDPDAKAAKLARLRGMYAHLKPKE